MNKSAIKNFATWARKELMKQVSQKAFEYGITKTSIPENDVDSIQGRLLTSQEKKELKQLIDQINKYGYDHVIEEVAYTWFNRFIALRFMEVNNYLPQRIRVFTNENNEFKPELLNEAIHVELEGLDQTKVFNMIEQNDRDSLYKYLLLCLCNDMKQYLPDMFTSIEDYKALLMPDNLLREDSVLGKLIEDIEEEDWKDQVQIIGWIYQYYNTELKAEVMKKKNYSKDDIPPATQLFTPEWIVQYMVENSLGRLYIDKKKNMGIFGDGRDSKEMTIQEINQNRIANEKIISELMGWKYFLPVAEQEEDVIQELKRIEWDHEQISLEDLKVIDPCMGSSSILLHTFDVLMDIYRDMGYSNRDAARSILENNLYGLEIDERAYQLAFFSLMMKAREYDRRILSKNVKLNVLELREPSKELIKEYESYLGEYVDLAKDLIETFKNAKEFGSFLVMNHSESELLQFKDYLDILKREDPSKEISFDYYKGELIELLQPLVRQALLLAKKYDVVITNPPYMSPTLNQKKYLQKNYPDSKSDLFAVFIERCQSLTKKDSYQAMITMHSWMFLSSYEKLRTKLLKTNTIVNMAHLGTRAFEDIGGEVVQTTAFVFLNRYVKDYKSTFKRLVDYNSQDEKERQFLLDNNSYFQSANNFSKISGRPIAYQLSQNVYSIFSENSFLSDFGYARQGLGTSDNNCFLRLWTEIEIQNIGFNIHNVEETILIKKKWYPYIKGGTYRRWYPNKEYVVNYQENGRDIKNAVMSKYTYLKSPDFVVKNTSTYFHEGITWSDVASGNFSGRWVEDGYIYADAGPMFFSKKDKFIILGFMNSGVFQLFGNLICQGLHYSTGQIPTIPYLDFDTSKKNEIEKKVKENIWASKSDWDSFETSWDFTVHPLVKNEVSTVSETYSLWAAECLERFDTLKASEEELNQIFIDIYGLQDELDSYVEDKDVTVRKADLTRDIKSLISYAVGCMFGRYSLDVEGLAFAGGDFDASKYSSFTPDADDILPICDEEYFEGDIVTRFIEFVRVVYGSDTLETNLEFVASALGGKGTPREVLRNYFLNDFYKDHCKIYQKRPIYWLFDSGKKNGFKSLVYIHRYAPDLIARMRTGYVHPQQARYRTQVELLENQIEEASSTSERVRLNKQLKKVSEQAAELAKYEEIVHHWADRMEPMDLDDGVKVNYEKFKDLLAKLK